MKQLKIGSSWIRGVVGNGLTPELVTDFACAFGTYVDGGEVVLGYDSRRSSPLFAAAVTAGLLSTGTSVANAGLCATPIVQYLVRKLRARGGIVVSGSHNDSAWNALKFINARGALFNPTEGEELLDLYHAAAFKKARWNELGRERTVTGFVERYLEDTIGRLDLASLRSCNFRVAVDAGNGTAGPVVRPLFELLGCKVVLINEELDGVFARGPAPSRENMKQLAALMRHIEADVGFAVNSDVDRVGIVTESGEALSEEYTFPLVAQHVLREPGQIVVSTFSTSRMIDAVAGGRKARVVRTKIGEGNVVARCLNENAVLGGEGSGGVAYLPVVRGFDGFVTMALLLEAMAQSGKTIGELSAQLPSYTMKKGVVPSPPDRVYYALEEVRRLYRGENVVLADGVLVSWPDRWLHVRASTTEPLLRVIVEGEDAQEVERLFEDTVSLVNAVVHGKS